jgi:hypothetical protein
MATNDREDFDEDDDELSDEDLVRIEEEADDQELHAIRDDIEDARSEQMREPAPEVRPTDPNQITSSNANDDSAGGDDWFKDVTRPGRATGFLFGPDLEHD